MGSTQVDEPDPLDPEIIQRLDNRFSYRDISEEYYTDEDGDEVCAVESRLCVIETILVGACIVRAVLTRAQLGLLV